MKFHEKITVGGVIAAVGGIAIHIISDMFFTSNKFGLAVLVLGICAIGAGQIIGGAVK